MERNPKNLEMSSSVMNGVGMELDSVEVELGDEQHENDADPFIKFVEYARSILSPTVNDEDDEEGEPTSDTEESEREGPGWSWIASRLLKTCISYSSGVTSAILLSDLSQAWNDQKKTSAPRKRPDCINHLLKKHKRTRLPCTVTIDTVYEKNFLSLNSVLEAVVVDTFVLPGTNIYMVTLGDFWSSNTIDLYLHKRYYDLVSPDNGILKIGREVFLTGCYLRSANEGSGYPRLLPTEYLVVLLDEEQDDDVMLLGAQFCMDSFSSISLDGANKGQSYSLYARIESIGPLEMLEKFGGIQRKQIRLVDNYSSGMNFLLWGEQVVLANLLSVGSMLAIDRPFIASPLESDFEMIEGVCLEYGSATQLYLVPFVWQGEQVCLALTPNRPRGSKLGTASCPTQGPKASQLTLPCDSQGSADFSNYPFQSFIIDLHDKMTGISIYGTVMDISREANAAKSIFNLKIKDPTGTICVKLHFSESWSLGRLSLGHMVFVSGLTCTVTKHKHIEAQWFENDTGTSLVNLSCLPAIVNSSCLHKSSHIADLSRQSSGTHICRVWLDPIEHYHVNTRLAHVACGHFVKTTASGSLECEFCCNREMKTRRAFHLKITVADKSGKVFAWCTGQTAIELLQISPDEFYYLPEEEQVIYPCSLENERYTIAIVNCGQQESVLEVRVTAENDMTPWEITHAIKL